MKNEILAISILVVILAFQACVIIPTTYFRLSEKELSRKEKTILNFIIATNLVFLLLNLNQLWTMMND